jgi:uncharacterized protein (DUF952 family)
MGLVSRPSYGKFTAGACDDMAGFIHRSPLNDTVSTGAVI